MIKVMNCQKSTCRVWELPNALDKHINACYILDIILVYAGVSISHFKTMAYIQFFSDGHHDNRHDGKGGRDKGA